MSSCFVQTGKLFVANFLHRTFGSQRPKLRFFFSLFLLFAVVFHFLPCGESSAVVSAALLFIGAVNSIQSLPLSWFISQFLTALTFCPARTEGHTEKIALTNALHISGWCPLQRCATHRTSNFTASCAAARDQSQITNLWQASSPNSICLWIRGRPYSPTSINTLLRIGRRETACFFSVRVFDIRCNDNRTTAVCHRWVSSFVGRQVMRFSCQYWSFASCTSSVPEDLCSTGNFLSRWQSLKSFCNERCYVVYVRQR